MKKNNIEIWRFLFTICVALLHFGYFNGFYIAVDFFFVLSAFLLCKSILGGVEEHHHNVLFYVKKRIARLYPHYLYSLLIMLIWQIHSHYISGIYLNKKSFLVDTFLEMIFLQLLYPFSNLLNGVTWYISALVIWLPIMVYLLIYHKRIYTYVIAPYTSIFIYTYFLASWGHVDFGFVWLGHFNGGLLRGLAALNLGVVAYTIYTQVSRYNFTKLFHNLLATIEIAGYLLIILTSAFWRQTKWDFIEITLIMFLIIISFIQQGFLHRMAGSKFVAYLGKLSYPIFLNHIFISIMIRSHWHGDITLKMTIVYIIVLTIYSMLTLKIVETCTRIVKNLRVHIKNKILLEI